MTEPYVSKEQFEELQEKLRQMARQYVTKEELQNVKEKIRQVNEDVKEVKTEMIESGKLLQTIDKKIDVINEKINSADEKEALKLEPIDKRISKLEENQSWLRKTLFTTIG